MLTEACCILGGTGTQAGFSLMTLQNSKSKKDILKASQESVKADDLMEQEQD